MAIGTGNLPNQNMVFTPFDILTAEEQNKLVENIEALADGTGLGDGSVTADKLADTYKIGTFQATSGTGNQSVTGIGFKPRLVEFIWNNPSTGTLAYAQGSMTANGEQSALAWSFDASNRALASSTSACIITVTHTNSVNRTFTFVSMDSDGFTINKVATSGTPTFIYKAYP